VREFTNFFMRSPQPRETTWVMVAAGEAKKVLETHSELEKSSAQSIGYLARAKTGFSVHMKDFVMMLAGKGTNPIASRIEAIPQGTPQGPGQEGLKRHLEVGLTGTAVFKKDKLVGWLDQSETRGLLWLRGEILKGIITVPSPAEPDKAISLNIIRGSTEVDPQYDGETVRFRVKLMVEGDVMEQQSTEELGKPEMVKLLDEVVAAEVEEKARSALARAQEEYGVDIFNFGEAFHRKYKKDWKMLKDRWDEVFSAAEVEFEVNARVRRTGMQIRRTSLPEE
ncbi:MAG: Ger(x)C family spore germination protein, partial [Peptococcaceae bacterium]|nr:Ger(x)C family spore germination protein [Peptococcaceae bacterium]